MDAFYRNYDSAFGNHSGSPCVLFLKQAIRPKVQKALLGFASGVMVAASVWFLLILESAEGEAEGKNADTHKLKIGNFTKLDLILL